MELLRSIGIEEVTELDTADASPVFGEDYSPCDSPDYSEDDSADDATVLYGSQEFA